MFPAEEIARIVGGELLRGDATTPLRAIHDSRLVRYGDLFIALPGLRSDGHDHLEEAFARGACSALVSRVVPWPVTARNLVLVPDVLTALHQLARAWREKLGATFVGITGTNGKTTVKGLLAHLLASRGGVYASPENYNTEVGLPLSLLAMPQDARIGVFELGAERQGDIQTLAAILRPDWGVITSIGPGHLEGLGSIDSVAEEKWRLVEMLPERGTAVLPAESAPLMQRAPSAHCSVLTAGLDGGDVQGRLLRTVPDLEIEIAGHRIRCPLIGAQGAINILLAVATAHALGVNWDAIALGASTFTPAPHRLRPIRTSWGTILDDSYNANPASTVEALRVLADLGKGAPIRAFVFGEMLGLGTASSQYHREVLDRALTLPVDVILPVGVAARAACRALDSPRVVELPRPEIEPYLRRLPRGAIVLVKGSRAVGLDALVRSLQATA
jgi:UDP-N-acetylmuramoyl-tripeptide--D-alanyl-D-alanine ligase